MRRFSAGVGQGRFLDLAGGGGSSLRGMIKQIMQIKAGTVNDTVPDEAFHAFAESLGAGGHGSKSSTPSASGSGGSGSDKIIAVLPGQTVTLFNSLQTTGSRPNNTISVNGLVVVTGVTGTSSSSGNQPAVNGSGTKYPGQRGQEDNNKRSLGGGRLAGSLDGNTMDYMVGPGGGGPEPDSNGTLPGETGMNVVSFFATYDEALAFANSQYNGAWVPS